MDIAMISALAALAGSGVGGMTAGITTLISERAQARAGRIARELTRREDLYRDFIVEASKVYANALTTNDLKVHEMVGLYSMISRMRILSSPHIIEIADRIMVTTLDTFFAPNRSIPELRELIVEGPGIDPLKAFSEAAREELQTFLK